MYKVAFGTCILLIIAVGCATTSKSSLNNGGNQHKSIQEILLNVEGKNITNTGFFIRKGRITTISENKRIGLYFSMKYSPEGKYLISLRSKTGMEAFRVYISSDSLLVNDRLNKNVLYGNTGDFTRISGIPAALLKISVGDLFMNKPVTEDGNICKNNEIRLIDRLSGLSVNSTIDCQNRKMKSIIVSTGEPDKFISIDYYKFRDDSYSVPRKVEVNDALRRIKIVISIDKYIVPWFGDIEFIPGDGYKIKPVI